MNENVHIICQARLHHDLSTLNSIHNPQWSLGKRPQFFKSLFAHQTKTLGSHTTIL